MNEKDYPQNYYNIFGNPNVLEIIEIQRKRSAKPMMPLAFPEEQPRTMGARRRTPAVNRLAHSWRTLAAFQRVASNVASATFQRRINYAISPCPGIVD